MESYLATTVITMELGAALLAGILPVPSFFRVSENPLKKDILLLQKLYGFRVLNIPFKKILAKKLKPKISIFYRWLIYMSMAF